LEFILQILNSTQNEKSIILVATASVLILCERRATLDLKRLKVVLPTMFAILQKETHHAILALAINCICSFLREENLSQMILDKGFIPLITQHLR